jgi:transglutaminase-like putative cysteine protease
MKAYLEESEIINYSNPHIEALAKRLGRGCRSDSQIARNCFEYVRDEIRHSGDAKDAVTTCRASDVLVHKTGWCYAKSHLLASLLRYHGIPTGFCYQRLSCSEYRDDIYCLHGLNAIYLEGYGWYRVDPRGNKEGVNAQFMPPTERLAFELGEREYDLKEIYAEPLGVVVDTLMRYQSYEEMVENFPDIES